MSAPRWGHVAEWLRSGLQNRLPRFNSGRGLHFNPFTHINALRLPAPVDDRPGEAKLRLGGSDRHNIVPCKMDFAAMR